MMLRGICAAAFWRCNAVFGELATLFAIAAVLLCVLCVLRGSMGSVSASPAVKRSS